MPDKEDEDEDADEDAKLAGSDGAARANSDERSDETGDSPSKLDLPPI